MADIARTGAGADLVCEDDAFAAIADEVLAAASGTRRTWRMPWGSVGQRPTNPFTGRLFKGSNIVALWAAAERHGYPTHFWATERAWLAAGGRLRPSAAGTVIHAPVFAEEGGAATNAERAWDRRTPGIARIVGPLGGAAEGGTLKRLVGFRRSRLFNQAEIWGAAVPPPTPPHPWEPLDAVERVLAGWRGNGGPSFVERGARAFWRRDADQIVMPPRPAFGPHGGLSGAQYHASVLIHEHVHATGAKGRLDRDSRAPFGSEPYAREELVACLGESFLGSRLGVSSALREDHADYVASWMGVLRRHDRRRAFFAAVSAAERACNWILAHCGVPIGGNDERHSLPPQG